MIGTGTARPAAPLAAEQHRRMRLLDSEDERAWQLPARRNALHQPADGEQDRSREPDLSFAQQRCDRQGWHRHSDDSESERNGSSGAVGDPPEEHAAEESDNKTARE